jgi:hypothetical protein
MPLMCVDCYEPRYIKYRSGVCCKKCGGYLVEIDENFLQAIILLNKKGYYTNYCCSSHCQKGGSFVCESYISFENGILPPYFPKNYKTDKELYPHVDWEKHNCNGNNCIRYHFDDSDMIKLQKEILQNAINVLNWAESLPELEIK